MNNSEETGSIQRDESLNIDELMNGISSEAPQKEGLSHGDTVELDDGETGIVIDSDHEMNKMIEASKNEKLEALVDPTVPMYEKLNLGDTGETPIDEGELILQTQPKSDHAQSIAKVKADFAGYAPSIHGLAPIGSKENLQYEAALEALRSGQVVLPTVEQYEQQKKELEMKRKEEETANMDSTNNQQVPAPQVINLAEMEEQKRQESVQSQRPVETQDVAPVSAQNITPHEVTEFKVPEGRVHDFVDTLTPEQQQKVEASKVIEIKEVRQVDVPVATRKVTSIDQYKRIASRKVTAEAVEVPLLNSGYVAIVKGCGSLEMASILPEPQTMEWDDYSKLYSFCYSNLVNSSIGYLSYKSFCVKTSPDDLPAMVHAILRASVPDEQSVTLTCGAEKCGKDYDITYLLSELSDLDSVDETILNRIDEIMAVKGVIDDARALQENSPVMIQKYISIGDGRTVCLRNPNGPITVERTKPELIEKISNKYSQFVVLFLLNIEKITLELENDKGNKDIYDLVDPEVIAEEIQTFSDTQLEILKEELQKLESYNQYTYSFKGRNAGPVVCPHCGLVNERIPCRVPQLVFQRVSRAMS